MLGLRLFLYKPRPARRPAQGSSTQVAAATGREFSHALLNAVMRKRDVELGSACNEAVKRQTTRFALEMPCDGHFLPWLTAPTLPSDSVDAASGGPPSSPSRRPLAGVHHGDALEYSGANSCRRFTIAVIGRASNAPGGFQKRVEKMICLKARSAEGVVRRAKAKAWRRSSNQI